jgi:uncharacterized repeat protein (TIGR02543 family)
MKKFVVFFGTILLSFITLAGQVQAQEKTTRIYAQDFSIAPGDETELVIYFEGNVYVTQAQFYLDIPEGFEFVNKGTARRPVYATNTEISLGLTLSSNLLNENKQLRITLQDASQIGTEDYSGELAIVYLKANENISPADYTIKLTNMVSSDEDAARYPTDDQDIKVSVVKQCSISVALNNDTYGSVTITPENQTTYTSGTEATVTATPTTGYEFVNWTSGEEEVSKENPYTFTVTDDVSLTANFQAATYTITYHPGDGATFTTEKNSYTIESEDITLDEPTKTGYKFDGWYDNAEFTGAAVTKIASGQTGDKEFYAKWTAETYTITYHPGDGATFTTEKNSYTIESEDITLDEPTMTGYDFGGWYDNAEFTGEAITKIAKGSTGNKEFFAKWTAETYTITYHPGDGATFTTEKNSYTIESEDITLDEPTTTG